MHQAVTRDLLSINQLVASVDPRSTQSSNTTQSALNKAIGALVGFKDSVENKVKSVIGDVEEAADDVKDKLDELSANLSVYVSTSYFAPHAVGC